MISFKSLLLHCYYGLQSPGRALVNAHRAAQGQAPIMVLCYHRVADDEATDWTQSTRSFVEQIRWMQRRFDMISLAEAQRRIAAARNCRPAVSITFDDGYAANCDAAIPLLIDEGIPCTYFVTSRNVLHGIPFEHDLRAGRPLAVNTPAELRAMAQAGIEIGNHSWTHANFGVITSDQRLNLEMIDAGHELSDALGRGIRYFAFPFGYPVNLSSAAFRLAKRHGYEAVCSAYGGFNFPGDDPFHLQRIPADRELIRLKNWLTVDPRKLTSIERFRIRWESEPAAALESACI